MTGFSYRLLVLPFMAIPVFAWCLVMTHIREEKYPEWLQKIFKVKPFGKILETTLIFLAIGIVFYMIVFFKLPSDF